MCPAPFEKIFWFSESANQMYIFRRPVPLRGAARDVTNAGRDAVDAAARLTGVACSGRRRRVVLTPRRWCQVGGGNSADDGGKKADHRGERGISRKPLRAGMSGDFPMTRCEYSCAYLLPIAHTRLRVHRAPGIPHALRFQGRRFIANLGRIASRECERLCGI